MNPTWTSCLCRGVPSERGPYKGMPVFGSHWNLPPANISPGSSKNVVEVRGRASSRAAILWLVAIFFLVAIVGLFPFQEFAVRSVAQVGQAEKIVFVHLIL